MEVVSAFAWDKVWRKYGGIKRPKRITEEVRKKYGRNHLLAILFGKDGKTIYKQKGVVVANFATTTPHVENRIFTFFGLHLMLDSDLTEL